MKRIWLSGLWYCSILLMLLPLVRTARAQQYFQINDSLRRVNIPFCMVRNMVIVKLKINNKGPYNFILDTGVGFMIITDTTIVNSLSLKSKHSIKISSLGDGDDEEAWITNGLFVELEGVHGNDIPAAILKKDHFGLSNYAGIPIHGLMGFEFFNSFMVKINFADSSITVGMPGDIRVFRKAEKIPITIEAHKPYILSKIKIDKVPADCKLLVDLGAGHPLLLENIPHPPVNITQKCIPAGLGVCLTGPINGFLSRISEFDLGRFKIPNVITSFPEYSEAQASNIEVQRDGNVGIEILKRFNVIFDYPGGFIYLKPNASFKKPFLHDMSGLEYYADGPELKHIIISRVDPGSAGDAIGLEKGDEITTINLKNVSRMSVEEIDNLFQSGDEKTLFLQVRRANDAVKGLIITLKKRI